MPPEREAQPALEFLRRWSVWRLVFAVLAAGHLLAVWGFLTLSQGWRSPRAWADALYRALQLFFFEFDLPSAGAGAAPALPPLLLEVGRWLIVLGVLSATFTIIGTIFRDRLAAARLAARPPDVLFCGLDETALHVAAGEGRCRLVAVTPDPGDETAEKFRRLGGTVVHGDPALPASLRDVNAARTRRCVYVWTESDAAARNVVEVLAGVIDARRPVARGPVQIVAGLRDPETLRDAPEGLQRIEGRRFELAWVDPHELVARVTLSRHPPDRRVGSVEPEGRPSRRIHVLLCGTTEVGRALVAQVVRNVYPTPDVTRVTVVGADAAGRRLLQRYPVLAPGYPDAGLFPGILPLADVRLVEGPAATLGAALLASWPVTCAYVDEGDDDATQAACRRLRQLSQALGVAFPVVAYFRQRRPLTHGIAAVFREEVFHRRAGEGYLGARLDERAMLLDYCFDPRNEVPRLGEPRDRHARARAAALRRWRTRKEWERVSSRHAADHIAVKLRAIGQDVLDESENPPDAALAALQAALDEHLVALTALEHRRYCAERILGGWLPIDDVRWQRAAEAGTQDQLRDLRLNATLQVEISSRESAKDERIARHIPWILSMSGAGPRPDG